MTRYLYGGDPSSYVLPGTGDASAYGTEAGAKARDAAQLVTDLQSATGDAQAKIKGNAAGYYSFYGPDGRTAPLWVSDGSGGAVRVDVLTSTQISASISALNLPATYASWDGTNLRQNGAVIPVSGGGSGVVDEGY